MVLGDTLTHITPATKNLAHPVIQISCHDADQPEKGAQLIADAPKKIIDGNVNAYTGTEDTNVKSLNKSTYKIRLRYLSLYLHLHMAT